MRTSWQPLHPLIFHPSLHVHKYGLSIQAASNPSRRGLHKHKTRQMDGWMVEFQIHPCHGVKLHAAQVITQDLCKM